MSVKVPIELETKYDPSGMENLKKSFSDLSTRADSVSNSFNRLGSSTSDATSKIVSSFTMAGSQAQAAGSMITVSNSMTEASLLRLGDAASLTGAKFTIATNELKGYSVEVSIVKTKVDELSGGLLTTKGAVDTNTMALERQKGVIDQNRVSMAALKTEWMVGALLASSLANHLMSVSDAFWQVFHEGDLSARGMVNVATQMISLTVQAAILIKLLWAQAAAWMASHTAMTMGVAAAVITGALLGGLMHLASMQSMTAPSRQYGGSIDQTGLYMLHRGEYVVPRGAGASVSINFYGNVRRDEVEEGVVRGLRRAGIL